MAGLGYPILGDSIYSANDKWPDTSSHSSLTVMKDDLELNMKDGGEVRQQSIDVAGERLHLHAHTLSFNHPISKKNVKFTAISPF